MKKMSWSEFQQSGLLFFVNQVLHAFGVSLVLEHEDDGTVSDAYPARTTWRGFPEETVSDGYTKITRYMATHAQELLAETAPTLLLSDDEWLAANGFRRDPGDETWSRTIGVLEWRLVVVQSMLVQDQYTAYVDQEWFEGEPRPTNAVTAARAQEAVELAISNLRNNVRSSLRQFGWRT
jgi:hypothetical protein